MIKVYFKFLNNNRKSNKLIITRQMLTDILSYMKRQDDRINMFRGLYESERKVKEDYKSKIKQYEKTISHLRDIVSKQDKCISNYIGCIDNLRAYCDGNDTVGILVDLSHLADILTDRGDQDVSSKEL